MINAPNSRQGRRRKSRRHVPLDRRPATPNAGAEQTATSSSAPVPPPVPEPPAETDAEWTKAEIRELLTADGIEHDGRASRAELLAMLPGVGDGDSG